ncbi:16307_t:CDS:2, partial [Entrophospora sp. SA101]
MGSKLDLADYKINIIEHGGEEVKLITLINQAVTENLIHYGKVYFLPFPPNVILPKTNFFNLFLGFKAQPATEINFDLINPIIWHIENIWCNGDKILSDPIQGRKLIIMNEMGMASGEWHKANDHLKSLITEEYILIEHKGLESKEYKHFPGFMVLSNHDTPLWVEIGDGRIIALDVSPQCKGNNEYFKQLSKILRHTDTPGSFMLYLLSLDLSDDWNPQHNIPKTKMKMEMMQDQLPNPTQFIIDHISPWSEDRVEIQSRMILYQEYQAWCEANGEKPFSNNVLGKKFTKINIENKQVRINGIIVRQYILDRSKIVAKLCESIGEIEEFSNISQDSLPTKSSMEEIPVFNVPEMKKEENKPEKAIPTQPEDLVASTPRNSKIITPKVINSSEIIEIPSP